MYQFINIEENIKTYNKVNKTQILLNSYYFLNNKILKTPLEKQLKSNWYVKDATWESTISHELGHYILFVAFLKENNLKNITLETKENTTKLNTILKIFDKGDYSTNILTQAVTRYNEKYRKNITINDFAKNISTYASTKSKRNKILADEAIAEAVHDYYLHQEYAKLESIEIINLLKEKLE